MLGRRAVVARGRDAAELFYDTDVVERQGAIPAPLADLLFGRGAIHGTDGAVHESRKRMFLEMLTDHRVEDLAATIGLDLERRVADWPRRHVVVFDELVEVYGAAVQAWAGLPPSRVQARQVSRRLAAIVDGFGGAGLAYPRAWAARRWANRWALRLVEGARSGQPEPPPRSILAELATGPGAGLEPGLAGVELLNILRPTVAVAWPATFLARELSRFPQWRPALDDPQKQIAFGHEVRRTCPFVPALVGRVLREVEFGDTIIGPGDLIVLDVPGTNRDPRHWNDADQFLPERFEESAPDPFAFVPQGGGDPATGHRCPGEPLTVRTLSETARVLSGVDYEPIRDTAHDPTRMPTLPKGGLPVRVTSTRW